MVYADNGIKLKERKRRWSRQNRDKMREYQRAYYLKHKDKQMQRQREYRAKLSPEVRRARSRRAYICWGKVYAQEYGRKMKSEALLVYGRGKLGCVVCGESRLACLSIDHIDGGGNKHRRSIGENRVGLSFYKWLKDEGFPNGYQTLCMNCQFVKRIMNLECRGKGLPY